MKKNLETSEVSIKYFSISHKYNHKKRMERRQLEVYKSCFRKKHSVDGYTGKVLVILKQSGTDGRSLLQ